MHEQEQEQQQEQERQRRAQEAGARLAESTNLSPAARKWIVNAGLLLVIVLAMFAARSMFGSASAGASNLPGRLSCGANQPSDWESGEMIFDLDAKTPTVTLTGSRPRIIVGKVDRKGDDTIFAATGALNVSTGSITPLSSEGGYVLRPLGKAGATGRKVRLSISPGIGTVDMLCISQP
jgi:hypothetical protein